MLRYLIGAAAAQRFGPRFPVGTLTINISACFLIGIVVEYLNRHAGLSDAWRYLIPVGFIGAYSTFSTFEFELWMDFAHGAWGSAILYLGASLIASFIAVALGTAAARALP